MRKITNKILITMLILLSSQGSVLAKETGATPYEHMPIDTFIAGFPLETLIFLGLIAYAVGTVYIFNAVLLKNKNK